MEAHVRFRTEISRPRPSSSARACSFLHPATRILQQPLRQLTSEKSYKLRSGGFFIVILCLEEEVVHHGDTVVTRAQVDELSGKFVDARAAFDTRQARRI